MVRRPSDLVETRRWGPGTAGIIRLLIAADSPLTQRAVAAATSVSQPRVSQVMSLVATLGGVRATPRGYVGARARLMSLYAARTKPTLSGPERFFYGTRPLHDQARAVAREARRQRVRIAFSADLAPDLLVAWRHPTVAVVYALGSFSPKDAGLVYAEGRADASIILRLVGDTTLLVPAEPWPAQVDGIPLADPVQQWWDLLDLGGDDRSEAARRLRRAILDRSIASS